jgi:spore coat protein CotH
VACKGKHRKTVIYPQNPNYANDFPGLKINGRVYRSNDIGHMITVPFDCNAEYMVAEWERSENELRMGKQKQHHSGTMGPGGNRINPLTPESFLR